MYHNDVLQVVTTCSLNLFPNKKDSWLAWSPSTQARGCSSPSEIMFDPELSELSTYSNVKYYIKLINWIFAPSKIGFLPLHFKSGYVSAFRCNICQCVIPIWVYVWKRWVHGYLFVWCHTVNLITHFFCSLAERNLSEQLACVAMGKYEHERWSKILACFRCLWGAQYTSMHV